jgi:signal transduction histidine kinase
LEYCAENNLDCTIHLPENIPVIPVSGETRRNIFLTVKESLHNIVKHARAKNVEITVGVSKNLDITIRDDGKGFEKDNDSEEGNGLRNMQKRIESIGGEINFQNESGVTVNLRVPIA